MNADQLKALQAPIKDSFKKNPSSALITLKAEGRIGEGIACRVVRAEGDLDFRGTLGVAKDAPVGFREIRLQFDLDTDAPAEQQKKLIELTERYCVVLQTLRNSPPTKVAIGS